MYYNIAKKLLTEELERIKLKPKYYCSLYQWDKQNEHAHKFIKKLVVRESAIQSLSLLIEQDHKMFNKWDDADDHTICQYDDMMIAEYLEEILKDFTYQIKSYTIGIPLFEF